MAVHTIPRVTPQEVKPGFKAGSLLLVNAYSDPEKAAKTAIPGALTLPELNARLGSLPKDQEIVTYCA